MAERVRKTQEEEIVDILNKEGFEELSQDEVKKAPYKSIYFLPDCIKDRKAPGESGEGGEER